MTGLASFIRGIFSSHVGTVIFFIEVIMFSIDMFLYTIVYRGLTDINQGIDKKSFHGVEDLLKKYMYMANQSDHIDTRSYIEAYFSDYRYLSHNKIFNKLNIPIINIMSIVHMTISVFILMGVLGTFTGLTISLNSLRTGEFTTDNISPILSGMGVAFYASIVGITFSLILTFITKVFDGEQLVMNIMVKLQDYMNNNLRKNDVREASKKIEKSIEELCHSNNYTISKFSETSSEIINKSLYTMEKVYEFVKRFSDFPKEFQKSIEYMTKFNDQLKECVEGFDLIFKGFDGIKRSFDKNISNLDKKFDILEEYILNIRKGQDKVGKSYMDIYGKLSKLTDGFYFSLDNLEQYERKLLQEMKDFYDGIKIEYIGTMTSYEEHNNRLEICVNDMSENFENILAYLKNIQKYGRENIDNYNNSKKHLDEFKDHIVAYGQQRNEMFTQIYKDMRAYQRKHESILINIVDKIEHFNKSYNK